MKRVGLTITAFLILLASLFMMYSLKLQETVQLWKHYNIVYVSSDYSEADIYVLLASNGAEGVISRENSLFSVKNHMLPTLSPYDNEGFTSESMRSFFFNDKSDSFFLFYVPEESLETVTNILSLSSIPFGIDASAEYPILCPILCFAAFLLLMIITRMPLVKACCLLPLVAVSYAVPFYSVAAAICCFLYAFAISDVFDGRKGALHEILKNVSLYLSVPAGLAAALLSGKKAALLIVAGLALSAGLVYLFIIIRRISLSECHFKPVLIIPAKWIDRGKRYNMKTIGAMVLICACFLVLSLFSGILGSGFSTQDLLLPSPSSYTDADGFTTAAYTELSESHESERNPDLTDFLNEKWYAETAAYRKVNTPYTTVQADEKIILPTFAEKDGLVEEKGKVLFSFDDTYISSTAAELSRREGIEKLLVSQDGFFGTDYASTGELETSSLIVPATLLCVLCFILIAAVYCIKRLKK